MKKRYAYIRIAALIIASVLCFGSLSLAQPKAAAAKDKFVYVERVVDGDTIKLSNGKRVRMIGIDTPELHYSNKLLRDAKRSNRDCASIQELGKKAASFTKKLVDGKKVRLEFDIDKKDRYGRLLAYVYLEDGTFVNAKILEEGYAQVMTIPPNVKYSEYFLKLQREARENKRGLWSDNF